MNLPLVLAESQIGDAVVFDLGLPDDLDVFRGHFPGLPVLPGVAQIDWAFRLAKSHRLIGSDADLREFQVKFRSVIRPGIPLTLTLRWDGIKRRIAFEYHSAGALMSSGRLIIQASPT